MSTKSVKGRRRPGGHITLARAARLHRLVMMLGNGPTVKSDLLSRLEIGLRTFYRELELLKKCGIRFRLDLNGYVLRMTPVEAEGRLPFPDPQLSFAEMAELSKLSGPAASRLAALLATVVAVEPQTPKKRSRKKASKSNH